LDGWDRFRQVHDLTAENDQLAKALEAALANAASEIATAEELEDENEALSDALAKAVGAVEAMKGKVAGVEHVISDNQRLRAEVQALQQELKNTTMCLLATGH